MESRQVRGSEDAVTVVATTAVVANRFISAKGTYEAGKKAVGVSHFAQDDTKAITVDCGVFEVVEAGAAVAQWAEVEADSNGRAITLASGTVCGRACTAASAAGDKIKVQMY